MHAAYFPLKDELRAKYNKTAVLEFFKQAEGLPYGYHNFLFGWIDTKEDNLPPVMPWKIIPIALTLFERLQPATVLKLVGEGLNMRLGTKGLSMVELYSEVEKHNTTMEELWTVPEQDKWEYSDGWSYVCSSFVVAVYKEAGLFGDLDVQATEFTPRDLYELDFFNNTAPVPHNCFVADPELPYC